MHPQMQHAFAEYLEAFLGKITSVGIQTLLTSHSAHVANTMAFSKVRYAQKTKHSCRGWWFWWRQNGTRTR